MGVLIGFVLAVIFEICIRKAIDMRLPDKNVRLLRLTFSVFGKHTLTCFLYGPFMMVFPYVQYSLVYKNASVSLGFLLVFAVSLLSVLFVYAPFFGTLHRTKISFLRKEIIVTAIVWSASCAVLFYVYSTMLDMFTAHGAIIKLIYTMLLSLSLILVFLKISFDIAFRDNKAVNFTTLFSKNSLNFTETMLFGGGSLIVFPYITELFFLHSRYVSHWDEIKKLEFSRYMPIIILFFTIPLSAVLSYVCVLSSVKKIPGVS